jgi:hypothetical protein
VTTAIEIKSTADAQKLLEEHVESMAGTCVKCFTDDGVTIMVPCFARIEAARYFDRAGILPI